MFFNLFKRNRDVFLGLDIGTECVKVLFFQKKNEKKEGNVAGDKIKILAFAVEYFDKYGSSEKKELKSILKKTISDVVENAKKKIIFSDFDSELKNKIQKNKFDVLLTISADNFRARVILLDFERENLNSKISEKEEKNICKKIITEVKTKVAFDFSKNMGVLPEEINWTSLKIISKKIDGYSVPCFSGYEGKKIEVKALAVFLPKDYLKKIGAVIKGIGGRIMLLHEAETLPEIFYNKNKDSLFIDIGGDISQFFIIENGVLEEINEIKIGSKDFTEIIAKDLGIDEISARIFKEKYSKNALSESAGKKTKEMFFSEKKKWLSELKNKLKELRKKDVSCFDIYLFGGGSALLEFKDVLEEEIRENCEKMSISSSSEIKFVFPETLDFAEGILEQDKKNLQMTPLLLICNNLTR